MGWNNFALDATLDWSAQSFLNMFCEAYNERLTTAGAFGYARSDPGGGGAWTIPIDRSFDGSSALPLFGQPPLNVAVGDDVQGAGSVARFLYRLQYYTFALTGVFAKVSVLDSSGSHAGPWTTSSVVDINGTASGQSAGGFAAYQLCYGGFHDLPGTFTIAGIPAGHFRRRRPREVNEVGSIRDSDGSYAQADTIDTQGNAIATGMVAWLLTITSAYPYVLQSDGRWHQTTTLSPDVLDSSSAAPSHVAPGFVQAGDYIGWWLFDELRTLLNAMVRIPCNVSYQNVSAKQCNYTPGAGNLAANWAAATVMTNPRTTLQSWTANLTDEIGAPGSGSAFAVGTAYGFSTETLLSGGSTPVGIPLPTNIAKVVEFWATGTTQFEAVNFGFNPLHVPPDTGDRQGVTQLNVMEQYQLAESITLGATDANVDGSVIWGNLAVVPNECPVHPAAFNQGSVNGNSAIVIGIVRFDVTDGYRYSAIT